MTLISKPLISKFLTTRRSLAVLSLAALMPLGLALSGCSEAPKIPGAPKSESNKRDEVPAGAPAPQAEAPPATAPSSPAPDGDKAGAGKPDDAKPKSTAEATPPKMAEPPPPPVAMPDQAAQDAATRAREETMKRELKEMRAPDEGGTQWQMVERERQQKEAANKDYDKSTGDGAGGGSDSGGGSIGSAQPPPPPPMPSAPAAPSSPAPAPSEPSGGSATRGLTPPKPVAEAEKPKAFDVVPVFYGTDRVVDPDPKRLQYGTERSHKLQLGRALVTVPTAHKVPNIERPWVVELPYFKYKIYEEAEDANKHFTMQEISALPKAQMLAYVKERLAKSAKFKDHAFVFVHGFNTSFDTAIYRTAQIAYDLKFDGVPFVYSWPSGGKVASYTYDRGSVEQAEPQLAEFLEIVVKESGAKSISLIAHSMGNELLLRVLERLRPATPKGVVISQVILAAPDVDRDKFTNIAREITSFAKGVTLYAASNDRALSYSARFWGGVPRAGDVPTSGPLIIPGVDTIDVTAVSTDALGLNHSGYAENPKLLDDIALLLLSGQRPPDVREPSLLKIQTAAGLFWRYPPVTAAVP